MFTGIIQERSPILKAARSKENLTLEIKSRLRPKPGDSIAVNGVCLTVTEVTKKTFSAVVIPETLARSNLGALVPKDTVNLEKSLNATSRLDGHLVTGHVDMTVALEKKERTGRAGVLLVCSRPSDLARFVVEKGSVTLNGVSLTVAKVEKTTFSVALTPFTLHNTNLGTVQKGDLLNLEIDIMARYAQRAARGALNQLAFKNRAAKSGKPRIGIVVSEFNREITEGLLAGAMKALKSPNAYDIKVVRVPGAFEIPLALQQLIDTESCTGLIALGCVIKGETDHYRAVCDGVTYGIQKVSIENRTPIMFGVLMCEKLTDAQKRSEKNTEMNKGYECGVSLMQILKHPAGVL